MGTAAHHRAKARHSLHHARDPTAHAVGRAGRRSGGQPESIRKRLDSGWRRNDGCCAGMTVYCESRKALPGDRRALSAAAANC